MVRATISRTVLRIPSGRPLPYCMGRDLLSRDVVVGRTRAPAVTGSLHAPQVPDRLQRLVGGLDRLAVQLERALRLDQRDELLDRVDVARLEEALEDHAGAVL